MEEVTFEFCYTEQVGFVMGTRREGPAARENSVYKCPEAWAAPADQGFRGAL